MDGIVGRIDWDGCDDCAHWDRENCEAKIKYGELEIDPEMEVIVCKWWQAKEDL
jgi:hypothetical protein